MKRNKMTGFIWVALFTIVIAFGLLGVLIKGGISPEKQTVLGYNR